MSTSTLLNLGTRAMFASQAQLQTTGHNIANANVAGYSRQDTVLTTVGGQYSGAGYYGRGVAVQTVTRAVSAFQTDQVAQTKAQAAADSTRADMLTRLQDAFGSGEAGLGFAATKLFNAFSDVASSPADPSARQVVLARSEELASRFRASSDQIEALQLAVTEDVGNTVKTINGLAQRVAELNNQIASTRGSEQQPNDLLDQRDQLVNELSQHVQVTRLEQDDGSLNLFIGGGQSLVLGNTAYDMVARADTFDPARVEVAIRVAGVERPFDQQSLGGGTLAGLIGFQNNDLSAARNQLGQLASTLASEVNRQQSLGLSLGGTAGDPLFRHGAANAVPATGNAADAAGNPAGSVALTVTDSRALQASEYELSVNADGSFDVLRRSDGQRSAGLVNGAVLDGFQIDFGTSAPLAGDRFLLQPVGTAAQSIELALTDPKGIAAASPISVTAAPANKGTGRLSSVVIETAAAAPYGSMTLAFGATSAGGGRDYQLLDSGGGLLSSGTWSAGTPIRYDGVAIKIDGVPADTDTFAVGPTTFAASSNGNALALQGLADTAMTLGQTFTNSYAQTLSDVGVRVQSARSAASVSAGVADRAKEELGAQTGVNLDEEAARLLQYQQAYQAAAKILQTAQKVFDTVLSLGG